MSREREHSTTDIALALDVRKLRRAGDLGGDHKVVVRWTRGESVNSVGVTFLGGEHAFVSYRDERGEATTERIGIEWTFCNFGGERPWWTCPHCRRRCAIVYASGPSPFVCRLCASLTYETSQSDAYARANCKVNKRRERLGWERGAPSPPEPKGMHRRRQLVCHRHAVGDGSVQTRPLPSDPSERVLNMLRAVEGVGPLFDKARPSGVGVRVGGPTRSFCY